MNTLIHPFQEIRSFLEYHDYSLAIRRLLDICLDSGNEQLLRESIALSRMHRSFDTEVSNNELPQLKDAAIVLLNKLEDAAHITSEKKLLLMATGISKTYSHSRFSLQQLSLTIHSGDILGVVGENGNGKTTLLRCLAGQLALDRGNLQFQQLGKADHYAIKHHIAFIPQRIPKWYGQLKDNLHFSAAIAGIVGERNKLMVDFMLERLNLTPYAELNWNQISSGYRTRFELARILLQKPSLLILDEPLANLDINAQQTILTDLRYMAKSVYQPMGVVLSSQQLHEVEKVADTVLFIRNGVCLFRTDETTASTAYIIELETTADRELLTAIFNDDSITISYNGGFYTITSITINAEEILARLVQRQVPINYFRNITYSTKRFF